jgi:hypothetical protein
MCGRFVQRYTWDDVQELYGSGHRRAKIMDSLVRALGRFATRDIPFVIGGLSIILAFLTLIQFRPPREPSAALLLLSIGVAYPVGYIAQETLSLMQLVNSSIIIKQTWFLPFLYRFHSCLNRGIFGVFLGRVRARDMIGFGYLIWGDGWSSAPRSKSGN